MVTSAPFVVREAEEILGRDRKWFLKEYKDAKGMPNKAEKIAKDLHQHALNKKDIVRFRMLVFQLGQLERDERWQQVRIGFDKLKQVMIKLLQLPIFNHPSRIRQKKELIELTQEEHVFEGGLLADTTNKLDPLVKNKQLHQITEEDWSEIVELTEGVLTKLRALVLTTRRMEKVIEKATGIKI